MPTINPDDALDELAAVRARLDQVKALGHDLERRRVSDGFGRLRRTVASLEVDALEREVEHLRDALLD